VVPNRTLAIDAVEMALVTNMNICDGSTDPSIISSFKQATPEPNIPNTIDCTLMKKSSMREMASHLNFVIVFVVVVVVVVEN
jgi:hypothetical protein